MEEKNSRNGATDKRKFAQSDAPCEVVHEKKYPKGIRFILLTLALMLAIFIMALDTSIISTAIPSITSEFHSLDDIGWYTSAYLLPLMSLQPMFGKIYTFFTIKPLLIASMLVFECGSIICAIAPSSYVFIIGRVVAGVGAASIYAGGTIIITSAVPLRKLSMYLSALSSMYAVANLSGPPLGGIFTDSAKLTWRFCFWINLPLGFISIAAFVFILQEPERETVQISWKTKLSKVDLGGTTLFVSSVILLFIALKFGGNESPWKSPRVIVCFVLSGVFLGAFIILQRHLKEDATIPPRIFLNRSVASSVLVAALLSLGCNVHTFYLPFYFQSAKGTSASKSGLRLLPYTLSLTGAELVVGTSSSLIGVFLPFMYFGTSLFAIAGGLLCLLKVQTTTARIIGYQILAGVGVGSSMQLCATSVRAAVNHSDIPIAATLTIFAPFFGSAIGAAISQNIFRIELRRGLAKIMTAKDALEVFDAGGAGVDRITSAINKGQVRESYNFALSKTFMIAAVAGGVAFLLTLCIKWRTLKQKAESREEDVPKQLQEQHGKIESHTV
ncbi:major facilitator superfamily domain-containing protein [Dendryphion nanum]|uniref:Major facilitator superfamily domain-containing protein n=1 Tax=Dendryphion nanum TaxID=256645 RepID=A0A9P9DKT0_9PLEO|nr:major facilitator superfamily domain-containing protein [Dendryphion nanum]